MKPRKKHCLSLSSTCGSDARPHLLLQLLVCLPGIMLCAMMPMDSPSETLYNSTNKCFLLKVTLVMVSLNNNRKVTHLS